MENATETWIVLIMLPASQCLFWCKLGTLNTNLNVKHYMAYHAKFYVST